MSPMRRYILPVDTPECGKKPKRKGKIMKKKAPDEPKPSFVEALKWGEADYEDIHEYIREWHEGPYTCKLSEFLGMTREEYFAWLNGQKAYLMRAFPKGANTRR